LTVHPLRKTPSMAYGNLSVGDGYMIYCHRNEICMHPEPGSGRGPESQHRFPYDDSAMVMQAKAIDLGGRSFLVVGTTKSIQIWSIATKSCMIVHDLPEHDMEGGSTSQFARGAAGISNERGNFVCVGTSMGILHVFAIGEGNNATHHCTLEGHEGAITAVASEVGEMKTLASADQNGKIVTWSSPNFDKESVFAADGNPVTGVVFKGTTIVASLASGTIRLVNAKTAVALAEIGAHSRIITAIDVHPVLDMFVTVAEDTFVNVWTMPNEETHEEIKLCLNTRVENGFLTGVHFCGPQKTSIATVSYDLDKATVFDAI